MEARYPRVASFFRDNWQSCARHWAEWGRLDVLDKNCHTNNLVERFFGICKYDFLGRKTQSSIQELIRLLLDKVVPYYIDRRCLQLAGRLADSHATSNRRHDAAVQALLEAGAIYRCPASMRGLPPGHTLVTSPGGHSFTTVLGDLSCSCQYAGIFALQPALKLDTGFCLVQVPAGWHSMLIQPPACMQRHTCATIWSLPTNQGARHWALAMLCGRQQPVFYWTMGGSKLIKSPAFAAARHLPRAAGEGKGSEGAALTHRHYRGSSESQAGMPCLLPADLYSSGHPRACVRATIGS
jgi:hypothetical protein